jgi:hypothetical protein
LRKRAAVGPGIDDPPCGESSYRADKHAVDVVVGGSQQTLAAGYSTSQDALCKRWLMLWQDGFGGYLDGLRFDPGTLLGGQERIWIGT